MINITGKQIIPAVVQYAGKLAESVCRIREAASGSDAVARRLLESTTALLDETQQALDTLVSVDQKAERMEEGREQAVYYRERVVPAMQALRQPVDQLERIVDKSHWPMPSYGDLLFEV